MPEIIICTEHSQVYDVWKARGERGLAITHVDFHCDMSGLFLDRRRSQAYFIDGTVPGTSRPHSGNFLGHAVMEGIVNAIRWVHHTHGGRRYDTGTVKFETDLSARWARRRGRSEHLAKAVVHFEEMTFDAWDGPLADEHLDIDWDGLASVDYSDELATELTDQFLRRDFGVVPETTYLAMSPGYSNPDVDRFEAFVEALAAKHGARVTRLPEPPARPGYPRPPQELQGAQRLKHRAALAAHRLGVH